MPATKIIISKYKNKPVVCGFIDDKLEYLSIVRENELHNVYIGKVDHIVENIDAAFVRYNKNSIGYLSLNNIVNGSITNKHSNSKKILKAGDELLVQVESEAIKMKKCKLTTGISLSGKYCVVTLGRSGIGVSVKLNDDLRKTLLSECKDGLSELTEVFKSKHNGESCGFIIRTGAAYIEGNVSAVIYEDAKRVLERMDTLLTSAKSRTIYSCVYSPYSDSDTEEDILSVNIKKASDFFKVRGLETPDVIEDNGIHGIPSKIESLRANKVWLKSGAFLIIEQLESFNAIDVNTGKAIKGKKDITYDVNFEAVQEIMRQIRLRNLTGMILIDFINMKDEGNNKKLVEKINELCRLDPVHTSFIDITGLGIVELTRNKNDKTLKEILQEVEESVDRI